MRHLFVSFKYYFYLCNRSTNLNSKNLAATAIRHKIMLATDKQISYLCILAKKVKKIKAINSKRNVITANLPEYIDWKHERQLGVTVQDASMRISAYKNIICMSNATFILCGMSQI